MAEEDYEKKLVYAGEREEPQQLEPQKAQEEKEKKERRLADWLLVLVAIIGLALTVYYIGFGKIADITNLLPNMTNVTQPGETPTPPPAENVSNVTYGNISSITFTGNKTTYLSREDANLSLQLNCTTNCTGLYISLLDGSNVLAAYQDDFAWSGAVNVTIPFVVPKRANATLALNVFADSRNMSNTAYYANPDMKKTILLNVLENAQQIIYGKEFYLEVNEVGNLSDLNVSIRLDSIEVGQAHVDVINKDGVTFGSVLEPVNKPNATFFDFLTIQILNLSAREAKLIAWPNGMLEAISLQAPLSPNISTSTVFNVYLKCTGTCAATYVGVHILVETNLTRIGFYNETKAWSGFEVINITTTIPDTYLNKTSEVKILADTRKERTAYYFDLWNPPEKILVKNFTVQ